LEDGAKSKESVTSPAAQQGADGDKTGDVPRVEADTAATTQNPENAAQSKESVTSPAAQQGADGDKAGDQRRLDTNTTATTQNLEKRNAAQSKESATSPAAQQGADGDKAGDQRRLDTDTTATTQNLEKGNAAQSKESVTSPAAQQSADGNKAGDQRRLDTDTTATTQNLEKGNAAQSKESVTSPATQQGADGHKADDQRRLDTDTTATAQNLEKRNAAQSKESVTSPAQQGADGDKAGDPRKLDTDTTATAQNLEKGNAAQSKEESVTSPATQQGADGDKAGDQRRLGTDTTATAQNLEKGNAAQSKESVTSPVAQQGADGHKADDQRRLDTDTTATAQEGSSLEALVEELKATLAAKDHLIEQLRGKVHSLHSPSKRVASLTLPGEDDLPEANLGNDADDVTESVTNAIVACQHRIHRKSQELAQQESAAQNLSEELQRPTNSTTAAKGASGASGTDASTMRKTLPGRFLISGAGQGLRPRRRRRRRARASIRILAHQVTQAQVSELDPGVTADNDAEASDASESDSESEASEAASLEVTYDNKLVMTALSWKDLPQQVLQWLKSNLLRSEEAHAHSVPWEASCLDTWPELSKRNRVEMVEDFEAFLDRLGRFRPSKYEAKVKLRERLNKSEPPSSRRRSRSQGQVHPYYEFPLDVEPAEVSARLREALPVKRRAVAKDDSPGRDSCNSLDLTIMGKGRGGSRPGNRSNRSNRSDRSRASPSRSPERRDPASRGPAVALASLLGTILAHSIRQQKRWALRSWTGILSGTTDSHSHNENVRNARPRGLGGSKDVEWNTSDTEAEDRWRGRRAERDRRERDRRDHDSWDRGRHERHEQHEAPEAPDQRDRHRRERHQRGRNRSVPPEHPEHPLCGPPRDKELKEPREPREPRPIRIYQRPRMEDFKRPRWQAASRFEDYVGCVSWNYKEPRAPLPFQKSAEVRAEEWHRVLQNRFKLSDLREKLPALPANSLRNTTGMLKPVPLPALPLISARRLHPQDGFS